MEYSRHINALRSCRETDINRSASCVAVPPLHPIANSNRGFGLQPHDVHYISAITGGKILQLDCHPTPEP